MSRSHFYNVIFLIRFLLLCVEVDQFPVQQLIEQLEVLWTSLEFATF